MVVEAPPQVDFALGEDAPRNASARAAQEAAWSVVNVNARAHYSVREALHVQKPAILRALADYDRALLLSAFPDGACPSSLLSKLGPDTLSLVADWAMPGHGRLFSLLLDERLRERRAPTADGAFRVFVRVRPLRDAEVEGGEYVSLDDRASQSLACHDARLARSGRRLSLQHRLYDCDRLFAQSATDADVCATVLQPLLERVVSGVGDATVLYYGQTGAGKTHNLRACAAHVVEQASAEVEVLFIELAAGGCYDLLDDGEGDGKAAVVALRSDEEGRVHVRGARRAVTSSGEQLAALLAAGLQRRATVATDANASSSRSHAILELCFCACGRTLRLVDLAGSERNYETHRMASREFQRESAAINKSLMALKACLRQAARAREAHVKSDDKAHLRVPYRDSTLTRVLRQCFEDETHRTAILAAASPAASSVIHTLNTLDHVVLMAPHLTVRSCEVDVPHGGSALGSFDGVSVHEWTHEQVIEWLANVEGGRLSQVTLPPDTNGSQLDGRGLLGLSARRLGELVESGHTAGREDGQGWYVSVQGRVGRALWDHLRDLQLEAGVSNRRSLRH